MTVDPILALTSLGYISASSAIQRHRIPGRASTTGTGSIGSSRAEVKTSIIQGIAVFLSLFETNAPGAARLLPAEGALRGQTLCLRS